MLLACGVAAVVGLFLPLVHIKHKPVTLGLTAIELSFGMEKTRAIAGKEIPKILDKRLSRVRSAQEDLQLVLEASKWAVFAFLPGVLLGVLGAIGMVRKHVGRVIGAMAFLLGLGSIVAWLGLRFALQYAAEEADLPKGTEVGMELGAHVLIVLGALAVIAGLGALFRPDVRAQVRSSAAAEPAARRVSAS